MRNTSVIEWELARDPRFQDLYTEISDAQLKKLQDAFLSMFVEFDRVCQEHGLISYMVAGTLIGSLRHGGYIPWDDDIDLVMFREDYDKLRDVFKNNDQFTLISPADTNDSIFKVLKLQSKTLTYFDVLGEGFSKKKYLYLDMLPIDYVSEKPLVRAVTGFLFRALDLSHNSVRCYKKYSPHLSYLAKFSSELRVNLLIRRLIALPTLLIGPSNMYRLMEFLIKSPKKTSKITIAYGVKGYLGETLDADVFFPAKTYPFEGMSFYGPNDANAYLTNRYGDYMTPPASKEQGERLVRLKDDWKTWIRE